jgi:hypothetical protein
MFEWAVVILLFLIAVDVAAISYNLKKIVAHIRESGFTSSNTILAKINCALK